MSDTSIDPASAEDPHADKYNDPRARITRRGVLMGIGVLVFAIFGAAASIYGRRTRLGETTRFWGPDTITALQLGERVELLCSRGRQFPTVELSGMPGLGHLRHLLLDEQSFDWESETNASALEKSAENDEPFCVTIRVSDPTAHRFDTTEIDIDLAGGWVGTRDSQQCVQVIERKRSGLRHYLVTIMDKEQNRYDLRQEQ